MLKITQLDDFKKYTDSKTFEKLKPYSTILQLLKYQKKQIPEQIALENSTTTLTYKQLYRQTCAITPYLVSFKKQTHIAIISNSNLYFILSALGIMANGMVAVFIPPFLTPEEIKNLIVYYDIKMCFFDKDYQEKIKSIQKEDFHIHFIELSSINYKKTKAFYREINKNDVATIIFSKKQDGSFRGAMLTHQSILMSAFYGSLAIKNVINQQYYSVLPFTHVFGFVRNILTPLVTDSRVFICTNMRKMLKEIPLIKPQIMVLVPALLELLLNMIKRFHIDLFQHHLHSIIVGGAACPSYLIEQYHQMGIDIFQGYGMTETSNLVTGNPSPMEKPDSVGLIFPYQEGKIINGELYIKGPNRMKGYYKDEQENQKMIVDGFIKTGDLAYQDEDGYLYILGRCDELIVLTNGENISPVKIEKMVNRIDGVLECMVYEDHDILAIDIVLRKDVLKEKHIDDENEYIKIEMTKINQQLASYERISKINIVQKELNKDENMKIIRKKGKNLL